MLNKADIKKLAKKIIRHQNGRRTHEIMHPERDWLVGVAIAIVIVVVSAAWSGASYLETKNTISAGVAAEAEDAVVYRESNVETALQIAADRMTNLDEVTPQPEPTLEETSTSSATSSSDVPDDNEDQPLEASFSTTSPPEPTPLPLDTPIDFE